MKAHRRRPGEATGERPETREGLRRPALVEANDRSGDERLGVTRCELRGRVVLPPRREPVTEPLQRQPVEKLCVGVAAPCLTRQRRELGRRREVAQPGGWSEGRHEEAAGPAGSSGAASRPPVALRRSRVGPRRPPATPSWPLRSDPPRDSRARGGGARASHAGARGRGASSLARLVFGQVEKAAPIRASGDW